MTPRRATVAGMPASDGGDALGAHPARVAERAAEFRWDGHELEPGIGLALSGGGFRAALFHAGALLRLNEFGLLSKVRRVASVSGGSIAAGVLAHAWTSLGPADAAGALPGLRARVVDPLFAFSRRSGVDLAAVLAGLLPWTSAAEQVARRYDAHLFGGATLQDLPDAPHFVFCASNLQTGVLWRFSKLYAGDYLLGRLPNPAVPLASAVAASSAFPPFLSPLVLAFPPGAFAEWPSREPRPALADVAAYRARVVLVDGGVYDNHGLEPLVKRYMTVLASDGGAPFARAVSVGHDWFRQLRRVLELVDNQVRALRRRDLIDRFQAGRRARKEGRLGPADTDPFARLGAYWGIATDPAKLAPPDALPCPPAKVAALSRIDTRLSDPGEEAAKALVNWGYAICDRSVRTNYAGWEPVGGPAPAWPFADAPLG